MHRVHSKKIERRSMAALPLHFLVITDELMDQNKLDMLLTVVGSMSCIDVQRLHAHCNSKQL